MNQKSSVAQTLKSVRWALTSDRDGYRTVCAAIRDADLSQTTSNLAFHTLSVAGSEDQATPPDIVKAISDRIQGAEYVCLEDVGHLPCIEAPDRLAAILRKRLEVLA